MNRLLATPLLVALVLAALVLAAACADDDATPAAAPTTSTPQGATATSTTASPEPTTPPASPDSPAIVDAAEAARAWIAEVGGGDDEDAIALLSPRSLEAIGGPEGFRDRAIELAEGWGAWDTAEHLEVTAIDLGNPAGAAVVILHGSVSQEGPPEESWAAMPVVATGAGDRVEPFVDLGAVEADPAGGSTIEASARLTGFVPAELDVAFVVDAGQAVEPAVSATGDGRQRAELDVAGLAPGLHSLTVVVSGDGGVMARTFLYEVGR